jgi:pimeloyl-ACP methyl ester carboxylesterase
VRPLLFPLPAVAILLAPALLHAETGTPAAARDDRFAGAADTRTGPEFEWLRAGGFDTVICPFRGEIDYRPGEIECGLVKVPENREVAGSRTIELHFARVRARGEDHEGRAVDTRRDPVIYLTGGPGVGVAAYVKRLKDHRLVQQRDLYLLEQRGIGASGDFCPFFTARNRAEQIHDNFEDAQRVLIRQAGACMADARAAGVDVTGYHTFEIARDVKALRLALGLERWNVWGISYGSALGQAYLKVDPEGIRAMVLDAIVPLDLEELMRVPYWQTLTLERLFDACDAQPRCARAYPDLRARYMAALDAIAGQPIEVALQASELYPDGRAWFFQDLVAGLPFNLIYEESTHAALPAIVDGLVRAVETRDEALFRTIALADLSGGYAFSHGMATAVQCQDRYAERWAESAPGDFEAYPTLAKSFGSLPVILELPALCRDAGLAPRDPAQFALPESELPVLVANGAWDPITPVPLAERIMPGFVNGRLVVFPHAGHGPTRSVPCGGDFLNAYFDDPMGPLDLACVEAGQAARYIAPYFRTPGVARAVALHAEDPPRAHRHLAWAGSSLALVLGGFFALLLGWLGRRINGVRDPSAGGTRLLVLLATVAGLGYAGGLGLAVHKTYEVTGALLLFGMVSWARWVAWLGPLAGALAALAIVQAARHRAWIPPASLIGLLLVCAGVLSLAGAGLAWDLWPFRATGGSGP